jgi:hypothetical protein
MQWAREMHHGKEAQTIKINVIDVSLCNAHAKKPLTMTVRRPRIEVAGAPERAIAVLHPLAFETPFCLGHETTPRFGWARLPTLRLCPQEKNTSEIQKRVKSEPIGYMRPWQSRQTRPRRIIILIHPVGGHDD